MATGADLLWQPLLEAAAQTFVGAIGGYAFDKAVTKMTERHVFKGAMDLWVRGINNQLVGDQERVVFDGLISPYTQLFPGDPMKNATRWNQVYAFDGKIDKTQYQAMEFFAGSDNALRIGSLNGETLVGLFSRYGYVGEGLIGVVPTNYIRKAVPDFFHPNFYGVRARVYGRLALCPSQHGFVAQGIARKAGIDLDISGYKTLYYLNISKISIVRREQEATVSLLGSPWAVTDANANQYLIQYGYMSDRSELTTCLGKITGAKAWKNARVYYDDIANPSEELGFKRNFI